MALTDKLNAIGKAIRNKTNDKELIPLDDMPDKIADVYNVGYNKSADIIANNISNMWLTTFSHLFAHLPELTSIPYINTHNGTNFQAMFFCDYKLQSIPNLVTKNGINFKSMVCSCQSLEKFPQLDLSKGEEFDLMFWDCISLTELPELNTVSGKSFKSMCYHCLGLKKITSIDFSNATDLTNAFGSCISLEEIRIVGQIKPDISFADSQNLSYASLTNIKERLYDNSGPNTARTLTLHKTAFARLTQADIDEIWAKGWSIAV